MTEDPRQKLCVIRQIKVGLMANFSYLIGSTQTNEAAIVDPAWNVPRILEKAAEFNFKITKLLLTHTHFDHANALKELVKKTGATVYVHEAECDQIKIPPSNLVATRHDSVIDMGGFEIRCLHTPGHTGGSQCFLTEGNLFTGDTLFVGNCGRTDLPTGDPKRMFGSLQFLAALPPETIVWPGHDYGSSPSSTIQREKETNPCVSGGNFSDFLNVE